MSKLAQQHNINANMLFKWRLDLRTGLFEPVASVMMPVLLKPTAMAPPLQYTAEPSGMIEIIIGDAVVRLWGDSASAPHYKPQGAIQMADPVGKSVYRAWRGAACCGQVISDTTIGSFAAIFRS